MSETLDAPAPADNAAPVAPAAAAPAAAAPPPNDWRATLPPEIRDAPSVTKFQDVGALAKSYIEAEKLIGRKGVIVPSENATAEEQAAFRAALGVPESADAYGLKAPEGVPEGVWSEDNAKAFAAAAHKLGLTPAQAQGIAAWQAARVAEMAASAGLEADGRTWEDTLKTEWGAQFDAKLDLAKRAVREFGADAATLEAFEAKAGGAALMRMFARIGEKVAEDKPAGMGGGVAPVVTDPKAKAMEIINTPGGPYANPLHPEHRATVQQVTRLFEEANRLGR
jgi:hypothetical protein